VLRNNFSSSFPIVDAFLTFPTYNEFVGMLHIAFGLAGILLHSQRVILLDIEFLMDRFSVCLFVFLLFLNFRVDSKMVARGKK
jgi:hypothetical protein